MTSQLNVDTIVDKAGSGGTNVKMANTSTYVSDGGNATQNTVQGLAKAWVLADGDNNNSLTDSFNIASGTDNGTGDYTYAIANDMSNANFAASATGAGGGRRYAIQFGRTTGTFGVKLYDDNELAADNPIASKVHGDLA